MNDGEHLKGYLLARLQDPPTRMTPSNSELSSIFCASRTGNSSVYISLVCHGGAIDGQSLAMLVLFLAIMGSKTHVSTCPSCINGRTPPHQAIKSNPVTSERTLKTKG